MKAWNFKGCTALVTGANRGLGVALTEALLRRGVAKVYAAARDTSMLESLGVPRITPIRLDVTDADQLRTLAAAVPDLQLLVNNAGVRLATDLFGARSLSLARREMEVNYFGVLNLTRRLAPTLARNGGGAILNIGSAADLAEMPISPTYVASNAALHALTQSLRRALATRGTTVYAAYAGLLDTDMSADMPWRKTPARDVAHAILDGMEDGLEVIYPNPTAVDIVRND